MSADPGRPGTEAIDPRTADLDRLDALGVVTVMHEANLRVAPVLEAALPAIAAAVDAIAAALRAGGRLIYVGAGTSGRRPHDRDRLRRAGTAP